MAIDLWRTRPFMSGTMGRAVDRLFEEAFAPFYGGRDGGANGSGQSGVQTLPVTIWETDDAFHAALMAPGLDENSISVTVQEDTLSVEGELKFQPPRARGRSGRNLDRCVSGAHCGWERLWTPVAWRPSTATACF